MQAIATWNREPMIHASSLLDGWGGPQPERHRDFIEASAFPDCWRNAKINSKVEAKAKEAVVNTLKADFRSGRRT